MIRYMPEPSGGYAVSLDGRFIGRVSRHRCAYEHSNGRTYRYWSWYANPASLDSRSTYHHRTRAAAVEYLMSEDAISEQADALGRAVERETSLPPRAEGAG
jgi:hypothetical protein